MTYFCFSLLLSETDNDCLDLGGTARTLYDSLSNFGTSLVGKGYNVNTIDSTPKVFPLVWTSKCTP